jgi:hypothetical protein
MVFRSKERAAPHPRHGVGVGEGPTALRTRVTRDGAGGSDTLATRGSPTSTTARSPAAWPTLTHSEPTARLGDATGASRLANRWRASVASCDHRLTHKVDAMSTAGRAHGERSTVTRARRSSTRGADRSKSAKTFQVGQPIQRIGVNQ